MLTNCNNCQFCARTRHHHNDIGCAVNPNYWSMWFRLQHLEQSILNSLPIDTCRDFVEHQDLQPHPITLILSFGQWKTLVITNRLPREFIEQIRNQLNLNGSSSNEVFMQPVESSNIEAIGYNYANQDLFVDFLSGSRYRYIEVLVSHYEEFLLAPSKGQYFNRHIKHLHDYERVR